MAGGGVGSCWFTLLLLSLLLAGGHVWVAYVVEEMSVEWMVVLGGWLVAVGGEGAVKLLLSRERITVVERERGCCCCEEGELLVVADGEDGEMVAASVWPAHCRG